MRKIADLIRACKGTLLGDLCDDFNEYCVAPYPEVILAAALGCVSSAAQRSYVVPGGYLNTYQIIIGPPGCGKNDPLECMRSVIRAVDPRLACAEQKSAEVLKRTLNLFPSRQWIADEIGQIIVNGANPRSRDENAKKQCKEWLGLWPPPSIYIGADAMSKESVVGDTPAPRWSFSGAMTRADFDLISEVPEFVEKGLFSRICFWHIDKPMFPEFKPTKRTFKPRDETIAELQHHFKLGLYGKGNGQDDQANDHLPEPKEELTFEPVALDVFTRRWRAAEIDIIKAAPNRRDAAGSVVGRGNSKALTFASLHCISRKSRVIEEVDVNWGCDLAYNLVQRDLKNLSVETQEERIRSEILTILQKERAKSKGVVERFTIRDLKRKSTKLAYDQCIIIAAAVTLERDGLLICGNTRVGTFDVFLPEEQAEEGDPRHLTAV